ncbi:MAG: hypothetical protein APR53_07135 [Methanoculleus sp. SDB]|nr:MAG: hypothetical protein APR53_07135 [Methanoculleus sp. SDB]
MAFDIKKIIRELWDAQGYGNLAVYRDGSTRKVQPDFAPADGEEEPVAVLKPMALVAEFPMLDHALGNRELIEKIEALLG